MLFTCIFYSAERSQLLDYNPSAGISAKAGKPTKKKEALTDEQVSLYTFLNVIFRRYFGISIASSFFFGTGILIICVAAIVGNFSFLNIFLYGASVYACLSSNIVTLLVCLVVSVVWAVIYNVLGSVILSKSDVY